MFTRGTKNQQRIGPCPRAFERACNASAQSFSKPFALSTYFNAVPNHSYTNGIGHLAFELVRQFFPFDSFQMPE